MTDSQSDLDLSNNNNTCDMSTAAEAYAQAISWNGLTRRAPFFEVGDDRDEAEHSFINKFTDNGNTVTDMMDNVKTTLSTDDTHGGGYTLAFLEYIEDEYDVDTEILAFEEEDTDRAIREVPATLAWLRDDGGRFLRVFDDGELMDQGEFLAMTGLDVTASQTDEQEYSRFKAGKYVSRVFRPTPHDTFIGRDEADIHVNTRMSEAYPVEANDGLSIISPALAAELGVDTAVNSTGQLTILAPFGMVKGHYVVREIDHDAVVYGDENIKTEVKLCADDIFFAAEPISGTKDNVLLDIQTAFNLFGAFGVEQLTRWSKEGIQDAIAAILNGDLHRSLELKQGEHFDPDIEIGLWSLRAAVRRGVEYREFNTLVRRAWSHYKSTLAKYGRGPSGKACYRLPFPSAFRAYVRTDRHSMNGDGNYDPKVDEGELFVDKKGNLFIHPSDAPDFHAVHGGSDEDDAFVIVPLKDSDKSLVFRNPNQKGEVGVYRVKFHDDLDVERKVELQHQPEVKDVSSPQPDLNAEPEHDQSFNPTSIENAFGKVKADNLDEDTGEYTIGEMQFEWNMIHNSGISIGVASNAGMVRASALRSHPEREDEISSFSWDLESIIDAANKDGVTEQSSKAMESVREFFEFLAEENISLPDVARDRVPEDYRDDIPVLDNHPMDNLMAWIEEQIADADEQMQEYIQENVRLSFDLRQRLGKLYDEVTGSNFGVVAKKIRANYGRKISEALEAAESDDERKEAIEAAQDYVADAIKPLSDRKRLAVVAFWAYEAYTQPSERGISDSIVWIGDRYDYVKRGDNRRRIQESRQDGTSRYMLRILQHVGEADVLTNEPESMDAVDSLFEALLGETGRDVPVRSKGRQTKELDTGEDVYARLYDDGGFSEDFDPVRVLIDGDEALVEHVIGQSLHTQTVDLSSNTEVEDGEYDVFNVDDPYKSTIGVGLSPLN